VLVEEERCVGCGGCILVCPYGVLEQHGSRVMTKCDLCVEMLKRGQEPACVAGCPTGAIQFVSIEESGTIR